MYSANEDYLADILLEASLVTASQIEDAKAQRQPGENIVDVLTRTGQVKQGDVAQACAEHGVKSVAVTAGYVCPEPRAEFYRHMDAANVDLKAFSDRFYYKICGGHLQPVLETLEYIRHETDTWLELTTLLIPGENDTDREFERMTRWIAANLGVDVPLHFSAFFPAWKMLDHPPTPLATLRRARGRALGRAARAAAIRHYAAQWIWPWRDRVLSELVRAG